MSFINPSSPGTWITLPYTFSVSEPESQWYANAEFFEYRWSVIDVNNATIKTSITSTPSISFNDSGLIGGNLYYVNVKYVFISVTGGSPQTIIYDGGSIPFYKKYAKPEKPTFSIPGNNIPELGKRPTFVLNSYNGEGSHTSTTITIVGDTGTIYNKSFSAVFPNVYTIDVDLPDNKTFSVYATFANQSNTSDISNPVSFKSRIATPLKPVITSPISNSTIFTDSNSQTLLANIPGEMSDVYEILWHYSTNNQINLDIPQVPHTEESRNFPPTISLGNLIPNNKYYACVKYRNNLGWSVWSDVISFTLKNIIPIAPVFSSITENSNRRLTITLNSCSAIGHSSTEYLITQGSGSEAFPIWSYISNSPSLNIQTIPLTEKVTYNISARFKNNYNTTTGLWNTTTFYVTPIVPLAPTNLWPEDKHGGYSLTQESLVANIDITHDLTAFQWEVSSDINFNNIVFTSNSFAYRPDGISVYSPYFPTNVNTTYFYRCKQSNLNGYGPYSIPFRFATESYYLPNKPSIISPTNEELDVDISPTITSSTYYSAGSEVHVSSDWEIRTLTDTLITASYENTSNKTSITFSNLNSYTDLKVRVRFKNIGGYGEWSEYNTFRTIAVIPNKPVNGYPLESDIDISINPNLESSIYSGNFTHIMSDWQISTDTGFSNIVFSSSSNLVNLTSITCNSTLTKNTNYYWKVRYNNSVGWSLWSDYTLFTTIINVPETPVIISPISSSTDILNPTITSSSYSGDGEHLSTIYEISLNSGFETLSWNLNTNNNLILTTVNSNGIFNSGVSKFTDKLNSASSYFIRIKHINRGGESEWSDIVNFITISLIPDTPIIVSPYIGQRQVILLPTITSSSYSGDNEHLSSNWQITNETGNIIWNLTDSSNLITTSLSSGTFTSGTSLENDKWYFVYINHKNSTGTSEWSEGVKFHSLVLSPLKPSITGYSI